MTVETKHADYGFGTTINAPFAEAVDVTIAALKAEGFGVLTTIDVKSTMKEKIDVEFEPYVILGACNPHLAYRALQAEHELGLLLPCNVIVHEEGNVSRVSVVDPAQMLGMIEGNPELLAVATEAAAKLHRVVDAIAARAASAA